MRANEEEIPSVPDTAPKAVQKLQKAKNKPSVQEILDSIEPPSSTYRPIQVNDRPFRPKLPPGLVTPLDFFSLFITPSMLEQISEFTNTKAQKAERTAIFLYPALGNLNINLQVPIGLVSHLPWLPSTLTGKVAVILGWQL